MTHPHETAREYVQRRLQEIRAQGPVLRKPITRPRLYTCITCHTRASTTAQGTRCPRCSREYQQRLDHRRYVKMHEIRMEAKRQHDWATDDPDIQRYREERDRRKSA